MSKATMLEPVTYAHFTEDGMIRMWSRNPDHLQAVTEAIGKQPTALITTTQAEAYADARVRDFLEASFDKSFSLLSAWLRSTQAVADMGQVATLTSLVEFALTNQGKTSDQLEAEYQLPASPTE